MKTLRTSVSAAMFLLISSVVVCAAPKRTAKKAAPAAVPTPESVFGFAPGADYHLADFEQMTKYFHALAAASPRVTLEDIGPTGYGRQMFLAIISSEANIRALEHYKSMVQQLASGKIDEATARKLSEEGKAIVWIDGGLHATEVAGAQQSPAIAYRVATEDIRRRCSAFATT